MLLQASATIGEAVAEPRDTELIGGGLTALEQSSAAEAADWFLSWAGLGGSEFSLEATLQQQDKRSEIAATKLQRLGRPALYCCG